MSYSEMRNSNNPFILNNQNGKLILFSKYKDVEYILRKTDKVSKNRNFFKKSPQTSFLDVHVLNMDGDKHLRSRKMLMNYFSSDAIKNISSFIESSIIELFDEVANKSEFDFVRDFSDKLPLMVISRILGIKNPDLEKFREWARSIESSFDSFLIRNPDDLSLDQAMKLNDQLTSQIYFYLNNPHEVDLDGLISFLIQKRDIGEIDNREIVDTISFLIFAGSHTTSYALSSLIYLLLSNDAQFKIVKKDQTFVPKAIDESLRYEAPQQRTTFRIATDNFYLYDFEINKGDQFGGILGSANRDDAFFENANIFNIHRDNSHSHLSFGQGIHNCLGKLLAKTEMSMTLSYIIKHFPNLSISTQLLSWRTNSYFRGLHSLPLVQN